MRVILVSLLIVTLVPTAIAKKKETTKSVMQEAFYSLTQLLPLISSEMKFSDKKNEKEISEHMIRMTQAFQKGSHKNMLKSPSFKPNIEAMVTNLEAAQISFNDDNKSFARVRLNESTSLCISCHTQLPKDQVMTLLTDDKSLEKKLDGNYYELGNLYFILRNYKKSISHYKSYIKQKSKKRKKDMYVTGEFFNKYLYNSYFNLVYITAKALKSPKQTIQILEELERTYAIPSYLRNDMVIWKNRAKFWAKKYPNLSKKRFSSKEITKIINNLESMMIIENSVILSSDYDYDLMLLSGILGNSLVNDKKINKGLALYWLGIAEYRLGKSIFYNIGDQYLKKCITGNKKKAIASKCFQALESEIIFRNTGTSGTHIPKLVKEDLNRLQKML